MPEKPERVKIVLPPYEETGDAETRYNIIRDALDARRSNQEAWSKYYTAATKRVEAQTAITRQRMTITRQSATETFSECERQAQDIAEIESALVEHGRRISKIEYDTACLQTEVFLLNYSRQLRAGRRHLTTHTLMRRVVQKLRTLMSC